MIDHRFRRGSPPAMRLAARTLEETGAGAELALTGAYRLAGELAAAAGDHQIAFRRYEEGHRQPVRRKQRIGPNVRLLVPKNRLGRWTRNLVARLPLLESMAGMERIIQPKNTEPLPDYARRRDASKA
jgi:2-polyprenyl-6-methoxyphenol hydroxylase-like FAD-dependent oxidoreductase